MRAPETGKYEILDIRVERSAAYVIR